MQFSVYPNPFSNNINVTGINNTKSATYKLFTIDGKLIKKGNLSKEDIGRVDVKDHYAFAAVSRSKYKQVLNLVQNEKIKGVKALIELAK